jgi:glycosyltransferase involved in cell wall biosynthesis
MQDQRNNRVLYLSYDGLTDPLGQSQILPYLCGLASGFAITIISFEKKSRFEAGAGAIRVLCSRFNLTWVPLKYHKTPPVFSTLLDVWTLRKKAKSLHRNQDFGVVHCRSYITSLVGLWMKRKYGLKFIFDMRGFWADERVDGGLWNPKNPVYRSIYSFFKHREKQFIKGANIIISLTENAKEEILRWNLNSAIRVIPCCADLDHFDPGRTNPQRQAALREELGILPEEFVLLYLGSLGTWYMVDEMAEFFRELKKVRRNARFLIVTPDSVPERYAALQADLIVCSSSHERVPLFISMADASVVFIKPVFSKKASSATKMAEALAMGIPVVTNSGWGDIDRFQSFLPGLLTVSDRRDYPAAVALLVQPKNPVEIRGGVVERFSLASGIALYRSVYQDLM